MRNIKWALCLVVTACVFGVGTAAASAHEFEASGGSGNTRGIQIGTEEFVVWPMRVQCNKSVSKGFAPPGPKQTFTTETKFSLCSTFGGGVKVTVSPAMWEYNAEGTQTLTNEVTIKPGSGLPCKYTIPPQTPPSQSLLFGDEKLPATTKFPGGQLKLNIYSKLKGLAYTAIGWPCTGPKTAEALKEEKSETSEGEGGQFVGANHEEVVGGNLTWIE
jgi:hypothetical protein